MSTLPYFLTFLQREVFPLTYFALLASGILPKKKEFTLNPIALREAKIVYNFGLSECNSVKGKNMFALEDQSLSFKN